MILTLSRACIAALFLCFLHVAAFASDPNSLMGQAIVLYDEAQNLTGDDRNTALSKVDEVLAKIETDYPESIFSKYIREGRVIGSIDVRSLREELGSATMAETPSSASEIALKLETKHRAVLAATSIKEKLSLAKDIATLLGKYSSADRLTTLASQNDYFKRLLREANLDLQAEGLKIVASIYVEILVEEPLRKGLSDYMAPNLAASIASTLATMGEAIVTGGAVLPGYLFDQSALILEASISLDKTNNDLIAQVLQGTQSTIDAMTERRLSPESALEQFELTQRIADEYIGNLSFPSSREAANRMWIIAQMARLKVMEGPESLPARSVFDTLPTQLRILELDQAEIKNQSAYQHLADELAQSFRLRTWPDDWQPATAQNALGRTSAQIWHNADGGSAGLSTGQREGTEHANSTSALPGNLNPNAISSSGDIELPSAALPTNDRLTGSSGGYWLESRDTTATIAPGQAASGVTVNIDNSVFVKGKLALPASEASGPSPASVVFSPDGRVALVTQTAATAAQPTDWWTRLAIVSDIPGRPSVLLQPPDAWYFTTSAKWSSDGNFVVTAYPFDEFESHLLLINLTDGQKYLVKSDRPEDQVSNADVGSVRDLGEGRNGVTFHHLACADGGSSCGMAFIQDAGQTEVVFRLPEVAVSEFQGSNVETGSSSDFPPISHTTDLFNAFTHVLVKECNSGCSYSGAFGILAITTLTTAEVTNMPKMAAGIEMIYQQAVPHGIPTNMQPENLSQDFRVFKVSYEGCATVGCPAALFAVSAVESARAATDHAYSGSAGYVFDYRLSAPEATSGVPPAEQSDGQVTAQVGQVIDNVADFFESNEMAAIAAFQRGQNIRLQIGNPSFDGGKISITNIFVPSSVVGAQQDLQNNFSWDKWFNVTQGNNAMSRNLRVICSFASSEGGSLVPDSRQVVYATLRQYESGLLKLNCTTNVVLPEGQPLNSTGTDWAAPKTVGGLGYYSVPEGAMWLQVASRKELDAARDVARTTGEGARIFRSENGWYAIVGAMLLDEPGYPFSEAAANLVRKNSWPSDSYLTRGDKFVEEIAMKEGETPKPAFIKTETLRETMMRVRSWRNNQAVYDDVGPVGKGEKVIVWGWDDERGECFVDYHEPIFVKCADLRAFESTIHLGINQAKTDEANLDQLRVSTAGTVPKDLRVAQAFETFRSRLKIDGPTFIDATISDCAIQIDVVSDVSYDASGQTFRYLARSVYFDARDVEIAKSRPEAYARGIPVILKLGQGKTASLLSTWVIPNPAHGLPLVTDNRHLMQHYKQNIGFFSHDWRTGSEADVNFIVAWEYETDRTKIMNSFWDLIKTCQKQGMTTETERQSSHSSGSSHQNEEERTTLSYYAEYWSIGGDVIVERLREAVQGWRVSAAQNSDLASLIWAITSEEGASDIEKLSRIMGVLDRIAASVRVEPLMTFPQGHVAVTEAAEGSFLNGEIFRVLNYARNVHQGQDLSRETVHRLSQNGTSGWTGPVKNSEMEFHVIGIPAGHRVEKYVNSDGREAVFRQNFDGSWSTLKDNLNDATYNYVPNSESGPDHMLLDVLPWMLYGVSPQDESQLVERFRLFENSTYMSNFAKSRQAAKQILEEASTLGLLAAGIPPGLAQQLGETVVRKIDSR